MKNEAGFLITIMDCHLPDTKKHPPLPPDNKRVRVIHISIQPSTWYGKLLVVVVGIAVMVVGLFFSLIVFVFFAAIAMAMLVYSLWTAYQVRKRMVTAQRSEQDRKPPPLRP